MKQELIAESICLNPLLIVVRNSNVITHIILWKEEDTVSLLLPEKNMCDFIRISYYYEQ